MAPADVARAIVPSLATGTTAVPTASMFIGTLATTWLLDWPGPQMRTLAGAFDAMAVTWTATAATPVAGMAPWPVTFA